MKHSDERGSASSQNLSAKGPERGQIRFFSHMYIGNKKNQNPPSIPKMRRKANDIGFVFMPELCSAFGGISLEGPEAFFTPVTLQPIIRPCRLTPRYHFGPILLIFTSSKPALSNHSIYSDSLGNSIHKSAMARLKGLVGWTGPMMHATPPGLRIL